MISIFRKRLSGSKLFKAIFAFIIISMLILSYLPEMLKKSAGGPDALWATINGRAISRNDFSRKVFSFEEQLQMMRAQYGQYADQLMQVMGMSSNPALLAHDALVREALMNDVADKLNIHVHPDYIKDSLGNIMGSYQELGDLIPMDAIDFKNGTINEKALIRNLRSFGMSVSDFDTKVEQALKRKMAVNLLSNALYIPKFELENEYISHYVPKTFSVMMIPKSEIYAEVKKDVISDNDLQAFFDRKNKEREAYMIPEKRNVRLWTITPHSYGIVIADEKINQYYEENKEKRFVAESPKVQVRSILLKAAKASDASDALEKAKKLRQELVAAPETFAARAKELSADTETASHGGLMKEFTKGDSKIDRSLERGAFLLKNKGDISEPITVKDGVVILQLVEKTPKTYKSLASVHKEITDILINQEFAKRFTNDMKAIYKDKNNEKMKEIITQKGFTPVVKDLIINDGSVLARTAFALPVDDYAFYVDNKEGHVVQVTKIQERMMPTLDVVRNEVKNDLIEERVSSLLRSRVMQAKKEAMTKPLADIAQSYKATVRKVGPVDASNTDQIASLRKEGMPIDSMLQIENIGTVDNTINDTHGYVMRLDELAPFKQEAFEGKRQSLLDQISRSRVNIEAQGFVASLYRNATISLNS